ncbi:MAG: hypothetical protein KKH22_02520 [Proteobacteria bacterium]|nr:hypothetical protein [Pseudomonadota bacterium]
MKTALFHVGLAKCASTFFGDQIHKASTSGNIISAYWYPWDTLINSCFAEIIGKDIIAFPQAGNGNLNIDHTKDLIASNECLTGHFPQPLRLISFPVYTDKHLREIQALVAEKLKALAEREFSGYKNKILIITREPESWLLSVYKNLVLMGVSQLPEQFFDVFGKVLTQWANVDFLSQTYKQLFGDENVLVLPFEMLREDFKTFAEKINVFATTEIILDNTPRNSGLSDSATEYFRRFWENIDKIAPPLPSWNNPTVCYKQQTWEYIHNVILNDSKMVTSANASLSEIPFTYKISQKIIQGVRANMQTLKNEQNFSAYLKHYFPLSTSGNSL